MIVFYDVLLIDNNPVIHQKYEQRREHLKRLIRRTTGKSDVVWRKRVDFSKPEGPRKLMICFANALVRRWEGLVLKPADEPYFEPDGSRRGRYPPRWLKLKKDCINGLGDTADLVVIGAGYDPKAAAMLKISNLSWTHFFLACLQNKEDIITQNATPSLFVFDCVHDCINNEDLKSVNQHGRFREMRPNSDEAVRAFRLSFAKMDTTHPKMSALFKQPFIFEIAGSGFDKSPNQNIFTLRFPRVVKIHWDRDWRHSVSLDELQTMAKHARTVPSGQTLEEELAEWVRKLSQLNGATKGKMMSWDNTEDKEEPSGIADESTLTQAAPRSARKGRTHMPSLFVRMDTDEMMPNEMRQKNGEVIESLALAQSSANIGSDSSPYRSSTSSLRMQKRERAVELFDLIELDRDLKKARRLLPEKSESERRVSADKLATYSKRPLQETRNSTRPAPRERPKNIDRSQEASKKGLDLVRKMAIIDRHLVHKRHRMAQIASKPSSLARMTLDPACNYTATSELNMIREAHSLPAKVASASSSNLLPPPTTNEPIVPDLENCQIILSPCLISFMPNLLSRLLEGLPTKMVLLLQQTPSLQIVNWAPRPASGFQTLFLVDANYPSEATPSILHQLDPHLRSWHPLHLLVWDWRILEFARQLGRATTTSKEDKANELKIATMSWVPPSDHSVSRVLVQWADGSTTREPLETFVKLERSLTN